MTFYTSRRESRIRDVLRLRAQRQLIAADATRRAAPRRACMKQPEGIKAASDRLRDTLCYYGAESEFRQA